MPYHAAAATSTPSDQLRPATESAVWSTGADSYPPPLRFMTPDAKFPHLSHPTLLRDGPRLLDPASAAEEGGAARRPSPGRRTSPPRGRPRTRMQSWTAAPAAAPDRPARHGRRRALSAGAAPKPRHAARPTRGVQKGGGFAEEVTRRAARLPRTPAHAQPVHEEPLMHAWQHMQQQVFSGISATQAWHGAPMATPAAPPFASAQSKPGCTVPLCAVVCRTAMS